MKIKTLISRLFRTIFIVLMSISLLWFWLDLFTMYAIDYNTYINSWTLRYLDYMYNGMAFFGFLVSIINVIFAASGLSKARNSYLSKLRNSYDEEENYRVYVIISISLTALNCAVGGFSFSPGIPLFLFEFQDFIGVFILSLNIISVIFGLYKAFKSNDIIKRYLLYTLISISAAVINWAAFTSLFWME